MRSRAARTSASSGMSVEVIFRFYHGSLPAPSGTKPCAWSGTLTQERGSSLDERDRFCRRRLVWLSSALLRKRAGNDIGRSSPLPQDRLAASHFRNDGSVVQVHQS